MLRLSKISKNYKVADTTVKALKGIDLSFRKSEFVSILGPSGCGKTTLLNIVGGLDKYSSGDLFINGRSTKEFKDGDWDVYRNHRVGFIFQSYNLIPHQTILGNVELALTIAGIGKKERQRRAKQALDKVGLKDQYNKKPNQLSGGQCQRVAIARALVNEPEILLADEPTGALDTVTSVQIMDLIKEISKDRLVIMVTHNPDLAEKYSTRIIKLLDGKVVDDNNPFSAEEEKAEVAEDKKKLEEKLKEEQKAQNDAKNSAKQTKNKAKTKKKRENKEKAKMHLWTAFKLSARNLWTKKTRTLLTSFAGAIGIIGVSLVLSISCGVKTYISDMQNDMLSGNPITISQSDFDLSAILDTTSFGDKVKIVKKNGLVNVDASVESLIRRSEQASKFRIENEITKDYVDFIKAMPRDNVASLFLDRGFDVTNNIYTDFTAGEGRPVQNISLSAIKSIYTSVLKETEYSQYASLIAGIGKTFRQAPVEDDYILSQYNILSGKIAKAKDEIMIVVGQDRELTDLLLTQLGYLSQEQFLNIIDKATNGEGYDKELDVSTLDYETLLNKEFTYFDNDTVFKDPENLFQAFSYSYKSEGLSGGMPLKVVGILEPKETISYGVLQSGFFYTEAFCEYVEEQNQNSKIVNFIKNSEKGIYNYSVANGQAMPGSIISYNYTYDFKDEKDKPAVGYVGTQNALYSLMGSQNNEGATVEIYELNTYQFGGETLPYQIFVYPTDFETKDSVLSYLDKWNSDDDLVIDGKTIKAEDRSDITYTDNITVIISMVNQLIDVITYALIGFTALSLVVSCVMIAIITYVSVVERTKEIGVIRSLGGRKRDVSYLFNAETFIIGLGSGLIGIGVTYLLSWIANLIISSLTMVSRIAIFPFSYAIIMVCVSVFLTVLSGLIPAMRGARLDPVNALRSE